MHNYEYFNFAAPISNSDPFPIQQMTIRATDRPATNTIPKYADAYVIIIVRRNPNAPVFAPAQYNVTISAYLAVQQSVVKTTATDADAANVSLP